MTNAERGLYILCLCLQWTQGAISKEDIVNLSSAMAQPSLSKVLAKFKICSDGLLRNERLEAERSKQTAFRLNRSESGKQGANKRWLGYSSAITQPIAQPMANDSSPSPSPSPSPNSVTVTSLQPLKAKKADSFEYRPSVRVALHWLNEKSGRKFRECSSSLDPINARMNETDVTLEGVKLMIERQCKLWKGGTMEEFLRPSTLFGKEKFESYYAAKDLPINENNAGINGNSHERIIKPVSGSKPVGGF